MNAADAVGRCTLLHAQRGGRRSADWNIHERKATRRRRIHRGHDARDVRSKRGPLLNADDDDCDRPTGQVLLILQILVGGEEDFETGMFGGCQQVPVLQPVPVFLGCRTDGVANEEVTNRDRVA